MLRFSWINIGYVILNQIGEGATLIFGVYVILSYQCKIVKFVMSDRSQLSFSTNLTWIFRCFFPYTCMIGGLLAMNSFIYIKMKISSYLTIQHAFKFLYENTFRCLAGVQLYSRENLVEDSVCICEFWLA